MQDISFWHRLINDENSSSKQISHKEKIATIYLHIKNDLENLLNTHMDAIATQKDLVFLNNQMFYYGLDQFTADRAAKDSTDILCEKIADVIRKFEPKLQNIKVIPQKKIVEDGVLYIKIFAILKIQQKEEAITFASKINSHNTKITLT